MYVNSWLRFGFGFGTGFHTVPKVGLELTGFSPLFYFVPPVAWLWEILLHANLNIVPLSWACWYTSFIPALKRQRQVDLWVQSQLGESQFQKRRKEKKIVPLSWVAIPDLALRGWGRISRWRPVYRSQIETVKEGGKEGSMPFHLWLWLRLQTAFLTSKDKEFAVLHLTHWPMTLSAVLCLWFKSWCCSACCNLNT